METTEIKSYNFSTIKYLDLENIVNLKMVDDDYKFNDWFKSLYKVKASETIFLKNLIRKNKTRMHSYMEEDLKMKFLSPILNLVEFTTETHGDWYDATLSGIVNGVEIKGFVDIMIASGTKSPRKPYFFIQEFKPSVPDRDPEVQLLAELLVTIEKNQTSIMRGGYIIGQHWKFVIVEKIGDNQFEYFVSKSFDSLDLEDLRQIYVILQTVKHKYCKD
jgi:hypothetical protein